MLATASPSRRESAAIAALRRGFASESREKPSFAGPQRREDPCWATGGIPQHPAKRPPRSVFGKEKHARLAAAPSPFPHPSGVSNADCPAGFALKITALDDDDISGNTPPILPSGGKIAAGHRSGANPTVAIWPATVLFESRIGSKLWRRPKVSARRPDFSRPPVGQLTAVGTQVRAVGVRLLGFARLRDLFKMLFGAYPAWSEMSVFVRELSQEVSSANSRPAFDGAAERPRRLLLPSVYRSSERVPARKGPPRRAASLDSGA